MEKKFSKIEIAVIKRTAQNVQQYVNKKEKLNAEIEKVKASKQEMIDKYAATVDEKIAAKVAKIQAEISVFQPIIDSFQAPIKEMTGGYTTEDLITREVVHTGKIDTSTGKELLQTRFVLKYPDTVVPPMTEDDVVKVVGTTESEDIVPPYAGDNMGSDFDLDSETSEAPVVEEMAEEEVDPFADWQ